MEALEIIAALEALYIVAGIIVRLTPTMRDDRIYYKVGKVKGMIIKVIKLVFK